MRTNRRPAEPPVASKIERKGVLDWKFFTPTTQIFKFNLRWDVLENPMEQVMPAWDEALEKTCSVLVDLIGNRYQ